MRAKRQPMSRQEFLDKVSQLLGKFDGDSFMHGFDAGVNRVCDVLDEWVTSAFVSEAKTKLLRQKIAQVRKTRR